MLRSSHLRCVLVCGGLFAPVYAPAQEQSGELRVFLRDSSGALLRGGVDLQGPTHRSAGTDRQGSLDLLQLPPGRYRVTLTAPGFEPRFLTIQLGPGALVERYVQLTVAGVGSSVTVVAPIPVGPSGTPLQDLPVPASGFGARALDRVHALDLPDALNKQTPGVYLNGNSGNPFQPDVNYRGYTASPLLGTPEGLSVYLDGVRQNQPFGDVVAWDLIPRNAIRTVALIPGADPLYGLNSLGGALAVETKDGASEPGLSIETVGGAFARRSVEGEYGGAHGPLDWYVAGTAYHEDGWRQDSPSSLRQSFARLRFQGKRTTVSLSGLYAINSLAGNGLQDFRALARGYSSIYSSPDATRDHAPALTLAATQAFGSRWAASATAYARHLRSDTVSGDLNTASFTEDVYDLTPKDAGALAAAGYSGFPLTGDAQTEPFPYWRCLAQALQNADPEQSCSGALTRARSQENNYGLSGVLARQGSRLALGAAWDRGSLSYTQGTQWGYLSGDGRTVLPVPAFDDDGVALHGDATTASVYAADAWTLGPWLVTAAGRYNRTRVINTDRLPTTDTRGSLNGSYVFQRLNPAIGTVYRGRLPFNPYVNYSEGSRAPTSIELGCANPAFPCNLPNALVSDPPLQQVVARTVEAGIRDRGEASLRWSLGWFSGQNAHDLLFVSAPQLGFGYFLNFGATRRTGAEATFQYEGGRTLLSGSYTFLRATYRSPQTLPGASNSSADEDGNITLTPGDRIPQTPEHVFKALAEYRAGAKWTVNLNALVVGSSFARGNENNRDRSDGGSFLGTGSSPGYGVINAMAEYQVRPRLRLFFQANNLLDRHFSTGAQLGANPFNNAGQFIAGPDAPQRSTTFLAPGAPVTVYGGLRVHLP